MSASSAIAEDQYRRVLRHLPTGVAVVSTHTDDGPDGMTVGSVTSVSLAPPLILFCPARASATWARIRAQACFCINVLGARDEMTARRFASRSSERFTGIPWHERTCGIGLDSAAAWIDCSIVSEQIAGDHTIVLAEVKAIEAAGRLDPLVFWGGGFGSLAPADGSPLVRA